MSCESNPYGSAPKVRYVHRQFGQYEKNVFFLDNDVVCGELFAILMCMLRGV